jgi:hypothetical protein
MGADVEVTTLPTPEQFAAATVLGADGLTYWKPEIAASVWPVVTGPNCVGLDATQGASGLWVYEFSRDPGASKMTCEQLALHVSRGARLWVPSGAVWPGIAMFDVWTLGQDASGQWAQPPMTGPQDGAYMMPPTSPSEQAASPGLAKVVPVWKQALTLGALGLGAVGVIWLVTRRNR